jgi:hypothetical protein
MRRLCMGTLLHWCTVSKHQGNHWPGQGRGCGECVQAILYTMSKQSGPCQRRAPRWCFRTPRAGICWSRTALGPRRRAPSDTLPQNRAWQILPATSQGDNSTQETRVQSALNDVAGNIHQTLLHRVPFKSREEGSECVEGCGKQYVPYSSL